MMKRHLEKFNRLGVTMKYPVLFVDDEQHILSAYKRNLRKYFDVHTALSGVEALALIQEKHKFAVIVSDMQMPNMNGVEFLQKAKELDKQCVRVMLTGNADQQTAIDAINQGDIYRFVNKPCSPIEMLAVLKVSLKQYQLIMAEQELLRTTLIKSIEALIEALTLACPESFGSINRIKRQVIECVTLIGAKNIWMYESMAMLALLGYISLSQVILDKLSIGEVLTEEEESEYSMHSEVGFNLINKIPRLEDIAQVIRYQNKCFDGTGYPNDEVKAREIPLGARVLKMALDYERFEKTTGSSAKAVAKLHEHQDRYDPKIMPFFLNALQKSQVAIVEVVTLHSLKAGMVVATDICTPDGMLLVSKGQEISESVLNRFNNFKKQKKLPESFSVYQAI